MGEAGIRSNDTKMKQIKGKILIDAGLMRYFITKARAALPGLYGMVDKGLFKTAHQQKVISHVLYLASKIDALGEQIEKKENESK